ncbi:NrfF protein [Vibrio navarrensis]
MELQAASSLSTYLAAMMVLLIGYPFGLVGVKLANSGCRVAKQKWVNRFNYFFALILLIFMIAHIHSDTFLAIDLLQWFKIE